MLPRRSEIRGGRSSTAALRLLRCKGSSNTDPAATPERTMSNPTRGMRVVKRTDEPAATTERSRIGATPTWINDRQHDLDVARFVQEDDDFVNHLISRAV